MEQIVIESYQTDSIELNTSKFQLKPSKPKKFMLHKMITKQQKILLAGLIKNNSKKLNQNNISNLIKQQKKKMLISTFVKKLKNSIILQSPPQEYDQIIDQQQLNNYQNIEISKTTDLFFSFIFSVQIIILLILISFSLIFKQISSQQCFSFLIFSFLMHLIEIIKKILVQDNYGDRKIRYLKDTIKKYIYSSDSIIDLSISIAFIISFSLNDPKNMTNYDNNQFQQTIHQLSRIIIMLKFLSLVNILAHIERLLIQNQYCGQLWQLCKVVILNFVIAHCLSLILIKISQFQSQNNWLVVKQIQDAIWYQKYIWSVYWATTIMLTVGFGDICPVNKHQALCMIFIQTISCIVLAYNINRLGCIISKIYSYHQQQNNNIKVFNQISYKTSLTPQLQNKITNYIKQSTLIKKNYNIQQQNIFISSLPQSFKNQLLKQMNNKIWKQIIFFQSLSHSLLQDLSKCLQKKLTHPDQTIYIKGQQVNLMIFNNGSYGLCYNKYNSKHNGKQIQTHKIKSNQYQIISLQFLFNNTLDYDIKCIDYGIFYKIPHSKFIQSLKNHHYDYQYFFMIKDKDKYHLNEYQIQKCKICINQKHTLFKCPRLHYIPLKQHIILKYKMSLNQKFINKKKYQFNSNRNIHIRLKPLINKKIIFDNIMKKRLLIYSQNLQLSSYNQDTKSNPIGSTTNYQYEDSFKLDLQLTNQQKLFVQCVTTKIKQNLNAGFKQNNHQQTIKVWDLQCDLANNFRSYFKRHNPNELKNKFIKKTKNNLLNN